MYFHFDSTTFYFVTAFEHHFASHVSCDAFLVAILPVHSDLQ